MNVCYFTKKRGDNIQLADFAWTHEINLSGLNTYVAMNSSDKILDLLAPLQGYI